MLNENITKFGKFDECSKIKKVCYKLRSLLNWLVSLAYYYLRPNISYSKHLPS